ncbi:uncharacterized protein [Diadema setosum]|uniref:uncharacterized protein n=1 Tax=Diadema setosum TaxID=31175 RepID=UPI003B3A72D1
MTNVERFTRPLQSRESGATSAARPGADDEEETPWMAQYRDARKRQLDCTRRTKALRLKLLRQQETDLEKYRRGILTGSPSKVRVDSFSVAKSPTRKSGSISPSRRIRNSSPRRDGASNSPPSPVAKQPTKDVIQLGAAMVRDPSGKKGESVSAPSTSTGQSWPRRQSAPQLRNPPRRLKALERYRNVTQSDFGKRRMDFRNLRKALPPLKSGQNDQNKTARTENSAEVRERDVGLEIKPSTSSDSLVKFRLPLMEWGKREGAIIPLSGKHLRDFVYGQKSLADDDAGPRLNASRTSCVVCQLQRAGKVSIHVPRTDVVNHDILNHYGCGNHAERAGNDDVDDQHADIGRLRRNVDDSVPPKGTAIIDNSSNGNEVERDGHRDGDEFHISSRSTNRKRENDKAQDSPIGSRLSLTHTNITPSKAFDKPNEEAKSDGDEVGITSRQNNIDEGASDIFEEVDIPIVAEDENNFEDESKPSSSTLKSDIHRRSVNQMISSIQELAKWYERYPSTPVLYWEREFQETLPYCQRYRPRDTYIHSFARLSSGLFSTWP